MKFFWEGALWLLDWEILSWSLLVSDLNFRTVYLEENGDT